jgi:hypothetical protein
MERDDLGRARSTEVSLVSGTNLTLAWRDIKGVIGLAWRDIKGVIGTADHSMEVRRLSGLARQGVDRLAVPVRATPEAAQRAGVPADQLDNVDAILRLFAGLLPGLILNVAMFHRAIA